MNLRLFAGGVKGWKAHRVGTDWRTGQGWYRLERNGVAMAGGPLDHITRAWELLR